jgi:hypothetical protein
VRNVLEYPVTLEEIVDCLKRLRDREGEAGRVGDMTPLLLEMAICAVRYRELYLWERGDGKQFGRAMDAIHHACR